MTEFDNEYENLRSIINLLMIENTRSVKRLVRNSITAYKDKSKKQTKALQTDLYELVCSLLECKAKAKENME